MSRRKDLRILLMQARHDQETIAQELDEFARFGELSKEQFDLLNLFQTPHFEPEMVEGYDALFIGGSSDASVRHPEKYPFVKDAERMLEYCVKHDKVVFASCFGFQIVTAACGGTVIQDIENQEFGTFAIELNDLAKTDPLLHDVPQSFWAISGHSERASVLPKHFTTLASSELCPYHIFRIEGKPFYGMQFHPEIDHGDFVARITLYQDRYGLSDKELARILAETQNTHESNALIGKFVDRIILDEAWRPAKKITP